MTATTNGASLEDCLTNIFSLIDLNGIRWKRFKHKENSNFLYTPIDTHPILTTYAKCIEENHIAVWRHEPPKRCHPSAGGGPGGGPGGGGTNSAGHSNFPTPTRTSNNNTPTGGAPANLNNQSCGNQAAGSGGGGGGGGSSNSGQNNYELWIFGYGHQLRVDNVIGDDLVEIEDDTWESKGLSYECRALLFKALHNLIERCLITKGFTRIGRWFVQPQTSLSFAFSFFVHGDSTICATVDVRQHPLIHPLSRQDLNTFQEGGIVRVALAPFGLNGILNGVSYKDSDNGAATTTFIQQWSKFYPLPKTLARLVPNGAGNNINGGGGGGGGSGPGGSSSNSNNSNNNNNNKSSDSAMSSSFNNQTNSTPTTATTLAGNNNITSKGPLSNSSSNQFTNDGHVSRSYLSNLTNMLLPPSSQKPTFYFNHEPNELPPVVEVIVSGYRMRYPSECVFTTTKVVDLYKSLSVPMNPRNISSSGVKRPNKNGATKPNKLSLLSEKLSNDEPVIVRVKSETNDQQQQQTKNPTNFISPFRLTSNDSSSGGGSSTKEKLAPQKAEESPNNNFLKQADMLKDRTTNNGCLDQDKQASNQTTTTTNSRYNSSSRVGGFISNNTPLGPTDLVKLFPTPPSLEQIILSPSNPLNGSEETTALSKDTTTLYSTISNASEPIKDNGIDVYKPVEYALMPPPPKWAALTNIIISSTKSLPPECIYKGSSQNVGHKNVISRFGDSNLKTNNLSKNSPMSRQFNTSSSTITTTIGRHTSVPSPLTDQTNKNGFNSLNLNLASPKCPTTPLTPTGSTNILNTNLNNSGSASFINPTSNSTSGNNIIANSTNSPSSCATTTFTQYTLPHQKLFNNLIEINSIQLNLMISDSVLGMFKDHNFEGCTLCVCNMSIKGTQIDILPQRNLSDTNNQWRPSMSNDMNSSFSNEFVNECTCGFSALTNRHCSHLSGLFLEDELEVTNVLYDPAEMIDQNKLFRKLRLSSYSETSYSDEQKLLSKLISMVGGNKTGTGVGGTSSVQNNNNNNKVSSEDSPGLKSAVVKQEKREDKLSSHQQQLSHNAIEETKIFVIDQLRQQCSSMIHTNSSLSKVLLIESFRNNRHLTTCSNYYAQTTANKTSSSTSLFQKIFDDSNKYTTVKMLNRNPISLKFSDYCELTKSIITKLGQNQNQAPNSRLASSLVKPLGASSGLSSIFIRMFGNPGSKPSALIGKTTGDSISSSKSHDRNNIFAQGLQALVVPTLSIDPKGALQMLEQLVKEESKEALATLNKAILIFSSPIHDWQFLTAPIPENNFDVANLLKSLQPSLDQSIGSHNKLYKDFVHQQQQHIFSARDSPTGAPTLPTPPCQGPLTWRQFHQAAGRGTEDQVEPQPIPSLLVSHHVEKNHLAVSPFALKFWDKLLLEPYAPGHNMFYLVIAPDNQNIVSHVKPFFKELSNTYELLKLGKHAPIGNGVIMAKQNAADSDADSVADGWFSKLAQTLLGNNDKTVDTTSEIIAKLRCFAAKFTPALAKTIVDFMDERQPPYDPHADRFDSSPSPHGTSSGMKPPNPPVSNRINQHQPSANKTFNQLLGGGLSSQSSSIGGGSGSNVGGGSDTTMQPFGYQNPVASSQGEQGQTASAMSGEFGGQSKTFKNSGTAEDNIYIEDEAHKQSGIVIYIVDPFATPSCTQNHRTLSTIGLLKCYSLLLEHLPENVRRITQLQLISLDSIISHSRPIMNITKVDQLKSISMNVYSRCRKILTNQQTAKSLTGFGPAAALEAFFKTKSSELSVAKMFTPPFILAPMKDKQTELGEMYGDRREKSSVLFCSYCITEDQRWLLASITNDKGEMSETSVININIVDRLKRPKASVKRAALRKLMDFIISAMSEWMNPWRLIIGKLGRIGHGELKEWATLLSKRSLLNYSRHLTERCRQCSILSSSETVSILSACLVSLEPDSKLRIMPDQFTSDDRQASFNKCPLSTPEDASATHILVFPTSASIQSSHGNVEDPLAGSGLDDDLLNQFPLEDGIEELGGEQDVLNDMNDLFSAWDDNNATSVSDNINSHHDTMLAGVGANLQMMGSGSVGGDNANSIQDETSQLLQQPLALGYYISTAKIGQMPNWFWSTSPHLRNSCPVSLKSALHIHMPSVQLSDDLLHSGVVGGKKSHQLDSNLTTDVLRYVLEGYNSLSWLALNPKTYDRQSCLPVHMQNLLQLYHLMESFS